MYLAPDESRIARAGELIILPAGVRHKVDVTAPRELRRWAHINYFILGRLELFSLLTIPPVIPKRCGEAVGDAIQAWLASMSHLNHNPVELNARRNEFGFKVLGLLAPFCPLKAGMLAIISQVRRIQPVIEYIHQHYHQPIKRDDLARIACLSTAQFHCLFKQGTGLTPMDFVRQARMRHAQKLLITTGDPAKSIAGQCGYADEFLFSKTFKRCCGFSPRQYRSSVHELRAEQLFSSSPGSLRKA